MDTFRLWKTEFFTIIWGDFFGPCLVHVSLMTCFKWVSEEGLCTATFCFKITQQFSMGLRSGKFTSQGPRIRIRLSASHFPTVFVRWQGAPSYWKRLQRHISIKLRYFSFSTFKYTVPLMEVPSGMNHKSHLPFAQIAPHIIIFAAFFSVGMMYCGEFLLFRERRTCLQKELNRDIWDSSENITHFHCSGVHAWYLLQKANLPECFSETNLVFWLICMISN